MKPDFSVVLIGRNEENTLPRLIKSLKEFQDRGGEIILVDTGSTDKTAKVAKDLGIKVDEVGDKFLIKIDKKLANKINKRFIVDEEPIVKAGDTLFDFASARNYASTLASNDFIATPDCDEIFTKFDIDKINEAIKECDQLEYNFVFSHDQYGNEAIKFVHSKFYNRTKTKWVGVIHEVLSGNVKRKFLDEDIIKLEHWQNPKTNRGGYLKGLAVDCYLNQDNDRNSHYFARELLWNKRPQSAIKEFERHIKMNRWLPEKAQSLIFIGDAYGQLNKPNEQAEYYFKAFHIDPTRREALIKLARFYQHNHSLQSAVCFTEASLQIPYTPFYANFMSHYTYEPHEILYICYGWLGRIEQAKWHLNKCLEYKLDSNYLRDYRYYNKLPKVSIIIPHIKDTRQEGLDRCLTSIKNLNYPEELIETIIEEGDETVPIKVERASKKATGDYIAYMADDAEFDTNALIIAVIEALKGYDLVAFNTGEKPVKLADGQDNVCEHFLIKKGLPIFDTRLNHIGVDNLLWKNTEKKIWCRNAIVAHYHFSRGYPQDEVYKKGWSKADQDRELFKTL
jgi:glycosyltransferase involved in cell wall biosynthesis